MDTLDRVVLSDPTRALQLVLVERDVAQLRESVQGTVASVRREIDLVYDISKYVIGTMLLLGLGNYVTSRRGQAKYPEGPESSP